MQKNLNIEAIKITAVFWVIVLHVSGQLLSENLSNYSTNFWIINIVDSFSRICVPLFLLASGRYLLQKPLNTKEFYFKRANRILIPLVFWSIVYSFFGSWLQKGKIDVDYMLNGIIHGRPFFHLWYLYMLVGLYLVSPILIKIVNDFGKKDLLIFSGFMIVVSMFYDVAVFYFNLNIPFIFWFMSYLGYFVAGYTLGKIEINIPKNTLLIIYILTSLSIAILSYLTMKYHRNNQYFYQASSPTVVLASLSFFVWMTKLKISENNFLVRISGLTLGIYLTHAIILELFQKYDMQLYGATTNPIFKIILNSLTVFICALLISKSMKIIGLKKLIQ